MFAVHHLYKSYNLHTILEDISFTIGSNERVGLIGPNGCGKTTLLRILAGEETADNGHITCVPSSLRLGYLSQGMNLDPEQTLDQALRSVAGDPEAMEMELARLAVALAQYPEDQDLQVAYDLALQNLQNLDRASLGEAAAVLQVLGIDDIDPQSPLGHLSGGQKTRLSLALVLLKRPQLLLLDEPTNHLDITMLEWLEDWLERFPGAALIVSHDRTFLDRTVKRILDLVPETHTLREYGGNYSAYLEQYLAERERQKDTYQDQVSEIRRMRQDINRTKQQAAWVEQTTTPRQPGVRSIAKKVAKKAKAREKRLERYLGSDERVKKPVQGWQMRLEFGTAKQNPQLPWVISPGVVQSDGQPSQESQPTFLGVAPRHLGRNVLSLHDLEVGYPGYSTLLRGINLQIQPGRRVALTGPNGCGKSALLRTIVGQLEPRAGRVSLGASVQLGYMPQEQELLEPQINAVETLRQIVPLNETEACSYLHYYLFSGDDALRPVGDLSFGERGPSDAGSSGHFWL